MHSRTKGHPHPERGCFGEKSQGGVPWGRDEGTYEMRMTEKTRTASDTETTMPTRAWLLGYPVSVS